MTVTITSIYPITIVSGDGFDYEGHQPVPAVTTDDLFNPDVPTQKLTDLLGNLSITEMVADVEIDATVSGNVPIYTVPPRQHFIAQEIIFAVTSMSGSGSPPQIDIGFAGSFKQLVDAERIPDQFARLTATGTILRVDNFNDTGIAEGRYYQYLAAGQSITASVRVPATYSTYRMILWLFGFVLGDGTPATPLLGSLYGLGPYGLGVYGTS